jgi:transposase InsO family protein
VRRLRRKRLLRPAPVSASFSAPNQEWAIDFLADGLATGRGLRILTVVDSYTRECLAIEVDTSLSSRRVTRVLEWIVGQRGCVQVTRCDNGPEFTSRHFLGWCEERGIRLLHIQPGRPMQNGRVGSFNGRFRDECLNTNWFMTWVEAKEKIERWREEYNGDRPHSSLAYRTPEAFAKACSELTSRMGKESYSRPSVSVTFGGENRGRSRLGRLLWLRSWGKLMSSEGRNFHRNSGHSLPLYQCWRRYGQMHRWSVK